MIINLGNEPHGKGKIVEDNVAAYKAIYEAIKEADPTIPVVATSVEPNEEYFKNGYGKYCDAFDFHIYESPDKVRASMKKYYGLMEKYDVRETHLVHRTRPQQPGADPPHRRQPGLPQGRRLLRRGRGELLLVRPPLPGQGRQIPRLLRGFPQHLRLPLQPLRPPPRRHRLL